MSPPKIARSVFTWKTKFLQRAPKVAKRLGYFVRNSVTKKFKKIAQSGHTVEHSNDPGTNLLFCWDTICKIIIFMRASCDAIASQRPTNLRSYNCVVVGTYSRNSCAKKSPMSERKFCLPKCFFLFASALTRKGYLQCDQIWRFIGLWATFQSFWRQLICPNLRQFL